jgi:hypothetical protein
VLAGDAGVDIQAPGIACILFFLVASLIFAFVPGLVYEAFFEKILSN